MRYRFRELREARGLKLDDVMKHIGISKSYLSQLETGAKPPNDKWLTLFAKFYNVSPADLFDETPGFGETSVVPWTPALRAPGDNRPAFDPAALAPNAKQPVTYLVPHQGLEGFGIRRNTLLIIDLGQRTDRIPDGALVVARVNSAETGEASSVVGRLLGETIIGPRFAADPSDRINLSGVDWSIAGQVVASVTAPDLVS